MARASGILLHITSLPSAYGIGDLGPESHHFADLLASKKQRYWSILPLSPTRLGDGNSPYQTSSAFAGNPLLISPELLTEDGLLPKQSPNSSAKPSDRVDFRLVYPLKDALLRIAYDSFKKNGLQASEFEEFCNHNEMWLNDYALYFALRQKTGKPWHEWLPSLRRRDQKAIERKQKLLAEDIEREKFIQYLFFHQWQHLKCHCQKRSIKIIGDMPFYVAHDSADVWVNPELFNLKANGKPRYVGGVPPDYFSASGQLWGNPTYNWKKHEETRFEWWMNRIRHNLLLCDKLRLDHFRGFIAYWQVSALAKTAARGRWVKTPSNAFFAELKRSFPFLPFIAEDLGFIDAPVENAIRRLDIPGMRVILFGLDGSKDNVHVPSNHVKNSVVYTGTHDTNTIRGWFCSEASDKEKQNLFKLVGRKVGAKEVSFEATKLALSSVADLCIIPFQDVLGLGAEARMNNPRHPLGNWTWRATAKQLDSKCFDGLAEVTAQSVRAL